MPGDLTYERFDEAMRDATTGLTHAALVGIRKQSVPDAEKMLSFHEKNTTSPRLNMWKLLHSGTRPQIVVVSPKSKNITRQWGRLEGN